jgi:hypothetical protein
MMTINVDHLIKDFWENRALGIELPPLDFISEEAIAYLRERYPYLQMISMNAKFEESVIPKFKKSPCGWLIHDYGQAMSSSPGPYLYGPGNPDLQEDEKSSGAAEGSGTGDGTLVRQTVDTARAMIEFAIEKGWPGVEIISGSELMQWGAWLAAQEKNYPLTGYAPSAEEQRKFDRIKSLRSEREKTVRPDIKPGMAGGE